MNSNNNFNEYQTTETHDQETQDQEKISQFTSKSGEYDYNKIDLEKLKITHTPGLFSYIFGANNYTSIHIAGFISITLVLCGIVISFKKENFKNHWDIFLPVITMCIGYIFGKKNN